MFYEQWNDGTSRFLLAYDDELQAICRALAPLDLSEVVSLREYYESPTPEAMTRKMKSIRAFEAVKVPLSPTEDGAFLPNWNDRMFTEDYPFGVAIIKDIATMAGVQTPTIDTLLDFYRAQTGISYLNADGALRRWRQRRCPATSASPTKRPSLSSTNRRGDDPWHFTLTSTSRTPERVFPDQGRYGMLRYDMNENPEGLPAWFVEEVKAEITPEYLSIYPEPDRFLTKYAKYVGVPRDCVTATNGTDQAIRYLLQTFCGQGHDVVTVAPLFSRCTG